MKAINLRVGTASAIGSLPHRQIDAAVAVALAACADLPAAPSLPARDRREGMVSQAAWGLRGVDIGDGRRRAPRGRRSTPTTPSRRSPASRVPPSPACAPSSTPPATAPRRSSCSSPGRSPSASRWSRPVRRSTSPSPPPGPRSPPGPAPCSRPRCASHRWPPRSRSSTSPSLVALSRPDFPLRHRRRPRPGVGRAGRRGAPRRHRPALLRRRRLAPAMAPAPRSCRCPIPTAIADPPAPSASLLDRGGWVAWGAVPTVRPVGDRSERLWRMLSVMWCELVPGGLRPDPPARAGPDHPRVRARPARPGAGRAGPAFTDGLAERLRRQAIGVRLVGRRLEPEAGVRRGRSEAGSLRWRSRRTGPPRACQSAQALVTSLR